MLGSCDNGGKDHESMSYGGPLGSDGAELFVLGLLRNSSIPASTWPSSMKDDLLHSIVNHTFAEE